MPRTVNKIMCMRLKLSGQGSIIYIFTEIYTILLCKTRNHCKEKWNKIVISGQYSASEGFASCLILMSFQAFNEDFPLTCLE